jgi:hypothetical protein
MIARLPTLLLALIATTLLGILLAALGPFGTYLNGPLPSRLGYWLATAWLGLAIYGAVLLGSRSWLTGAPWRQWGMIAAGSLLASLPEAWFSRKLAFAVWPMLAQHAPFLALVWPNGAAWRSMDDRAGPTALPRKEGPSRIRHARQRVIGSAG